MKKQTQNYLETTTWTIQWKACKFLVNNLKNFFLLSLTFAATYIEVDVIITYFLQVPNFEMLEFGAKQLTFKVLKDKPTNAFSLITGVK